MPKCKNCGARLSKFDSDMCPVCGTKNPLEGVSSETIEITQKLEIDDPDFKNYKPRKRLSTAIAFVLAGWSGAGFFYLCQYKFGIFWLFFNLVIEGGLGSLLTFVAKLDPLIGYLIPVAVLYVMNIVLGLVISLKPNVKDGRGEFLR